MQNLWISVALIVIVIIAGIIAGKRLSTPGAQRRAVYAAFATLAVLALWFFIFVAFFPAEWIVPFFTVACIIIPICVYMLVVRSSGEKRKAPSKRTIEIPRKDTSAETAKVATATTPSSATSPATAQSTASNKAATAANKPATSTPSSKQAAPSSAAKASTASNTAATPKKAEQTSAPAASQKPAKEQATKEQPKASAKQTAKPAAQKASQPEKAPAAKPAAKPTTQPAKAEKASAQATSKPVAQPAPAEKTSSSATAQPEQMKTTAAPVAEKSAEPTPAAESTKPTAATSSIAEQPARPTESTTTTAKAAPEASVQKTSATESTVQEHAAERELNIKGETTPSSAQTIAQKNASAISQAEEKLHDAAELEILVNHTVEEELKQIDDLVSPFAAQAAAATNAELERELNIGAPVKDDASVEQKIEPAPAVKSEPTAQPASTQTATSESKPAVAATPSASTTAPKPAAAQASTPAPTPAPAPAPKPKPKPARKITPAEHFAEFTARATALRDQGAYAIAAMLFEEAAALAPNANEARNTQFEELACFVKAGDAQKAKELAAKLRQSSVLTRFERIKLDAVERMS